MPIHHMNHDSSAKAHNMEVDPSKHIKACHYHSARETPLWRFAGGLIVVQDCMLAHTGKCIRPFGGIYAYCQYFIDRKW